jgi:hypothetical protein
LNGQPAAAIIVEPGASGAEPVAGMNQAGALGDIGEGAVAVLVKENIVP